MSTTRAPRIRKLDRAEIDAILARNHVGRLAYAWKNHVDIEPLHYVYDQGWIYGRTSAGTKLEATGETWAPVAFEVDEVEAIFSWRSVVVHGGFYVLDEKGAEWEQAEWRRGVELLRRLIPEALTDDDPVAFRTVIFRIAVQEASGREATPGDGDPPA
jgi:nitroimidazol reductase NimA-like FMN-containing flavoprotein (pyridoxamine 5'-phosphate oxidase superfamily)